MKKIFVLITVLIPFYVSSKDYFRPDTALLVSAIEEYWGNNSWKLEGKEINSYDDLKRPVFHSESWLDEVGADGHFWNYGNDSTKYEIVYFYDDIDSKEWIFARRDSFYVHHESDTVIVRYIRNGVWENGSRHIYNYNEMGNPIGEYHYYGNANGWVENSRHLYEYDFRGNKVSELYQIWDNNSLSWKNSYRQVLTYNVYGKLKSTKDSIWNNELSKFEPSRKTIYNYYNHSSSLIVMTYIQEWWNGIYSDFSKTYDTINANGKKIGTLNYLAINGDTLKPWYKLSYSYDFWGNLIEEISFLYADNSGWVNNLRRLYEYAYYLFKDTEKCKNYRRYTREYCKSNDPCSAKKDIRWNNLQLKRNVSRKALPETF